MPTPKNKRTQAPLVWQDAPELVTPPQAARLLGMHVNTIEKWLKAGKIPFTRVGRHRKIKKTDLAAHVGLVLASDGSIAGDDGTLLAEYAERFEAAIARLKEAQAARGEAITEMQDIIDEMKGD